MKKFFCGERGACEKCKLCGAGKNLSGLFSYEKNPCHIPQDGYGIAVDIGTSTIAFELFDLRSGESKAAYACVNSQREAFGADVMTRISRAVAGDAAALHECILRDLRQGIEQVAARAGGADVSQDAISRLVVCGNTTMLHFLQGFSVEGLGRYPFTPFSVEAFRGRFFGIEAFVLPGVSAFLGADLVAGLLHCGAFCENALAENFLYIDCGTNAEMAVFGNFSEKIYAVSAAAGPAFEKMSFQIVEKCDKLISFDTAVANNMFGADIVTLAAKSLRAGEFNPRDFADFLLAKAAVRAGIEILLAEAGISCENIGKVFLAGGFGYKIDVADATAVGLFPSGLEDKVFTVGNAALGGAARVLLNPDLACETINGFETTHKATSKNLAEPIFATGEFSGEARKSSVCVANTRSEKSCEAVFRGCHKHAPYVHGVARRMAEISLATHPQFEGLFLKNMEIL